GPMSKPVLETAIKIYKGYARYLREDVPKQLAPLSDAKKRDEILKTNDALAKEADAVAAHLEKNELPRADQSHVLGKERYKKLLKVQEGLDISLEEFEKMGEADLAANKKAYEALAGKVKPTRPKASELLAEATRMTEAARKFVVDKKIASIPADDPLVVKETP